MITIYDWNTKYATEYINQFGDKLSINPLHEKSKGSMITTFKNGQVLGGTYFVRAEPGKFYLGWGDIEFLLIPTEKGFDLISGETVSYNFTRIE